jgi:hypothetical protein
LPSRQRQLVLNNHRPNQQHSRNNYQPQLLAGIMLMMMFMLVMFVLMLMLMLMLMTSARFAMFMLMCHIFYTFILFPNCAAKLRHIRCNLVANLRIYKIYLVPIILRSHCKMYPDGTITIALYQQFIKLPLAFLGVIDEYRRITDCLLIP